MNIIRFAFIEAMVIENGSIHRCHLCRAFNIAPPTATKIFTEYRKAKPNNLAFDTSTKAYKKSVNFKQHYLKVDSASFLSSAQIMTIETIIQ